MVATGVPSVSHTSSSLAKRHQGTAWDQGPTMRSTSRKLPSGDKLAVA